MAKYDKNGHLIVRDSKGRFQKGVACNPRGRPPKSQTLTGVLRAYGYVADKNGIPNKRALAEKLWELAIGGSIPAARLIYEHVDGKPPVRIDSPDTAIGHSDTLVREIVITIPSNGVSNEVIDVEPISVKEVETTE